MAAVQSQAEADLAAALYCTYRSFMLQRCGGGQSKPRMDVGIITPYREQRACLMTTFKSAVGNDVAHEVCGFPFTCGSQ